MESGTPEEDLSESAVEKIRKYLLIRCYGSKTTVTFNEKAIAAKKKYHGYFALVSNCEKDSFECLRKYRRRETIEFFFESDKQKADGFRTRVWSSECLMGRMFVQFAALCYYEYLSEQLLHWNIWPDYILEVNVYLLDSHGGKRSAVDVAYRCRCKADEKQKWFCSSL